MFDRLCVLLKKLALASGTPTWTIGLFIFSMLITTPVTSAAEESSSSQRSFAEETVDDLAMVAATGLGGAILGLSTLSFEKEPSKHYRHVLVGGSIGIIVGVAIIAWGQATKNQGGYDEEGEAHLHFPQEKLYDRSFDSLNHHPQIAAVTARPADFSWTIFQWNKSF